jgi:hypothetical protein
MSPSALLLAGFAVICVLLLVLILRRPPGEQLIELRARFDALIAAQQEVPRTLAQGSAEQARVLSDVRERLGQLGGPVERGAGR